MSYKAALKQLDFKTKSEEVGCQASEFMGGEGDLINGLIKDIIPQSA